VIINQVKQKLHLVGYLLIRYFKDARYHEHKKKYNIVYIASLLPQMKSILRGGSTTSCKAELNLL